MILSDGKNKMLLQARENNLMATTRQINTTASSDVMQRIGTKVTLDLYEKSIITSFFYNIFQCSGVKSSIPRGNVLGPVLFNYNIYQRST